MRPGDPADFVVLSKDPLQDIRNTRSIVTVIHDGIEYDPAELLPKVHATRAAH
jgi:imidazolonepropionase-like amidohydrolase